VGDTHFNSVLLAPVAAVRVAQRHRRAHGHSNLDLTPSALNGVLELPLRLESRLIATGVRLPAGLSLLAVLRRSAVDGLPARRDAPALPRPQAAAQPVAA
jgi:hypothetical protein